MIVSDSAGPAEPAHNSRRLTIDEVFRCAARRRPDALALADAANRESFTDGKPRRLTYAEADRIVSAIAWRLRGMGLPTDAIIGVQLPNIAENVLAMLGVLRAGMIVAPLPLLWRRADAVMALARISAKALMTCRYVGTFNHSQFALRVAAEVFSIRYVCGFGNDLPDGVVSFDDLFAAETAEPLPPLDSPRQNDAATRLAAVTFDIGEGGLVPVARNHIELFAGGLAVTLESGMAQHASILSTLAPCSFAGICLTLLPWLLSGGTLILQHPFDPAVFAAERQQHRCDTLILPASVAFRLAEAGAFGGEAPSSIIAPWHSPEQLSTVPAWSEPNIDFVDVSIFGETALVPARRSDGGKAHAVALGPLMAPRDGSGAVAVAELVRTESGALAARGPMVPCRAFPPGIERSSLPCFKIEAGGFVDTGYNCRIDAVTGAMALTGPPSEIVSVGGYRFPLGKLQDVARRIDNSATLTALPEPLLGHRLIGNSADPGTMQAALNAVGVNPLVIAAFRERGGPHIVNALAAQAQQSPDCTQPAGAKKATLSDEQFSPTSILS